VPGRLIVVFENNSMAASQELIRNHSYAFELDVLKISFNKKHN
jgi:hypothetical protein